MRVLLSCLLAVLLVAGHAMAEEEKVELKTDKEKLSYALGLDIGAYFKTLNENLDLDIIQQGVVDSYKGNAPLLSIEEVSEIQQRFMLKQKEKLKQ